MNLMKKLILLQGNLLKKIVKNFCLIAILLILPYSNIIAKERWIIEKNLSSISFEVPILFAKNVSGEFKKFDGFVEIDLKNKTNNKALLSVDISSIEINYKKYKNLILGPIFFDALNYPIGVLDTRKFSYSNETDIKLNVELTIKGVNKLLFTDLKVIKLTNNLVQIKSNLEFNRNDFNIGTGNWSNTTILKNKIRVNSNIFLIKE